MPDPDVEQAIRQVASFIWEREGCPANVALKTIGAVAIIETAGGERHRDEEPTEDEEKALAGRSDANMPALLIKDVPGG